MGTQMLRLGMIGGGWIGQRGHLDAFTTLPNCRVTAIAELRPELGRAVAERYGIPSVYKSHRELLNEADVDAVIVVTRRPATGPIVLDALRAGKHVLSEKPMAHTSDQAQVLVDAARDAGVVYAVGFMKRHDPGVVAAASILEDCGELSPLISVRGHSRGGDPGGDFRACVMSDEVRPEGLELWPVGPDWLENDLHPVYAQFLNVHLHIVNLMRFLLPAPLHVVSVTRGAETGAVGVLAESGGVPVCLEFCERPGGAWDEGLEFSSPRRTLKLDLPPPLDPSGSAKLRLHDLEGGLVNELDVGTGWAFANQAASFVADVLEHRHPKAPGEDAVNDIIFAEHIWSATTAS